jgi:hypothetical protein
MSSGLTSNSQVITSNSQVVHDLNITCDPPKRRYVRKVKDSIWERFHKYGVKFDARVEWDALFKYEEVALRNKVFYKRVDFPEALVKVFKRSILVILRSSKEIVGLPVRDAEAQAKALVNGVLDRLPASIVVSNREVVSLHNSFVNHPTAKHDVNVDVDGESRLISDNSKGYPEFEAVSPVHAVSDSVILENFNRDLIVNNPEPLSVQGQKIDVILTVQKEYSSAITKHLDVEERKLQNEIRTADLLEKQNQALDRQNTIHDRSMKAFEFLNREIKVLKGAKFQKSLSDFEIR